MRVSAALTSVSRILLDTAPLIYYVQRHTRYFDTCRAVFDRVDSGTIEALTTPITLAECLVLPLRNRNHDLQGRFRRLVVGGTHTTFVPLDERIAERVAELRAKYNCELPDALQLAAALTSGCDAIFTNDARLKRITELSVLTLDELEPG